MSKHIVTRVLQVCGPCRILHAGAQNAALLLDFLLAGCDAYAFGVVKQPLPRWIGTPGRLPGDRALDAMIIDISPAIGEREQIDCLLGRFGTPKVLAIRALGMDRKAIENYLFESSW